MCQKNSLFLEINLARRRRYPIKLFANFKAVSTLFRLLGCSCFPARVQIRKISCRQFVRYSQGYSFIHFLFFLKKRRRNSKENSYPPPLSPKSGPPYLSAGICGFPFSNKQVIGNLYNSKQHYFPRNGGVTSRLFLPWDNLW